MGAWENGQSKIMCQFIAHAYFTTHWWFLFPPKKEEKTRATFSFMHPPCSWLTSQPASNPTAEADLLSMSVQVYRNRAVLCVAQAGEFTATFLSSSMHLSDQPANNPPAGRTSEHVSMQCSAGERCVVQPRSIDRGSSRHAKRSMDHHILSSSVASCCVRRRRRPCMRTKLTWHSASKLVWTAGT
jgi:hypothetical protein